MRSIPRLIPLSVMVDHSPFRGHVNPFTAPPSIRALGRRSAFVNHQGRCRQRHSDALGFGLQWMQQAFGGGERLKTIRPWVGSHPEGSVRLHFWGAFGSPSNGLWAGRGRAGRREPARRVRASAKGSFGASRNPAEKCAIMTASPSAEALSGERPAERAARLGGAAGKGASGAGTAATAPAPRQHTGDGAPSASTQCALSSASAGNARPRRGFFAAESGPAARRSTSWPARSGRWTRTRRRDAS